MGITIFAQLVLSLADTVRIVPIVFSGEQLIGQMGDLWRIRLA
jgi:hypothetical protein